VKYKIGDILRVHTQEWFKNNAIPTGTGSYYVKSSRIVFNSNMSAYAGKRLLIIQDDTNPMGFENYEVSGNSYQWQDWMFEDKPSLILRITTADPLYELRDSACNTLGKFADKKKVFTDKEAYDYYVSAFIAKHSILRSIHFKIIDTVRTDVEHQLLRATKGHPQPYCQSKRPDWNKGAARLPDDEIYSLFCHEHTPESFMAECQQRLCFRAMKETRNEILLVLEAMDSSKDPFFTALAFCCVPNCIFQSGCPEGIRSCRWFINTQKTGLFSLYASIEDKYVAYNKIRQAELMEVSDDNSNE